MTPSPFIIAEIGVNHDGNPQRALKLVEAAHAAGADAIKLQVFRADTLMHASGRFAGYQKQRCREADPAHMLRRYELFPLDLIRIVHRARELGLAAIATPFSPADLDMIRALDLSAIKIASPDIVNRPLLGAAARCGKPLIISTGAATMEEIEQAVAWLTANRQPPTANFSLLHCISSYPTPDDQANLCWIGELARRFNVPVGYSDHTTNLLSGALAVAAGASILEKHLTYDRSADGPDHAASADPAQFAQYVQLARQAAVLGGRPGKHVLPIEQDVRTVSRQSLVLTRDLPPGQAIREADLTVQRPGTGIPAQQFDALLGRRLVRPLKAGTMLEWEMVCGAAEGRAA
jgi:N-acetylneuraminate synthase/N,N'-diacetyllegionaminate synthase